MIANTTCIYNYHRIEAQPVLLKAAIAIRYTNTKHHKLHQCMQCTYKAVWARQLLYHSCHFSYSINNFLRLWKLELAWWTFIDATPQASF